MMEGFFKGTTVRGVSQVVKNGERGNKVGAQIHEQSNCSWTGHWNELLLRYVLGRFGIANNQTRSCGAMGS